jgi:tetrapyrrole methylase family protein/MazG family protein
MNNYPDEHPVILVHRAGTDEKLIEHLSLYQIDRSPHIGLLTTLFLPPLEPTTSFERFQGVIAHLRSPEGCPWDREQDHRSLRADLLEEAYEVVDAIDVDDPQSLGEELGDLLLLIVMHTQIAAEFGEFRMPDVISGIHKKIVSRHPHVFADLDLDASEDVLLNWERVKADERLTAGKPEASILGGVSRSLPALIQADEYQQRAARVGFDWPEISGVWEKLFEELDEVKNADDPVSQSNELGDLLFAIVNLARWLMVEPESALREANLRFRKRFARIEAAARQQGRELTDLNLDEMESIWKESKGI